MRTSTLSIHTTGYITTRAFMHHDEDYNILGLYISVPGLEEPVPLGMANQQPGFIAYEHKVRNGAAVVLRKHNEVIGNRMADSVRWVG